MTEHVLRAKIYEKFMGELREITTRTAYPQDVEEAVGQAYRNFRGGVRGSFDQDFETGDAPVPILFNAVGNRWDYGHPAVYRLEVGHVAALTAWWKEVEPAGWVMPAQFKPLLQCYEINLQANHADGRMFNYHVALIELAARS